MLADPLALSPDTPVALATNPVSFAAIKTTPDGVERLNSATDLTVPEKIVLKHSSSGNEKTGIVDRHLISVTRVERDANGVAFTATVNLTVSVPRSTLFTVAEVQRQVNFISNFISASGNMAKILQGQA